MRGQLNFNLRPLERRKLQGKARWINKVVYISLVYFTTK